MAKKIVELSTKRKVELKELSIDEVDTCQDITVLKTDENGGQYIVGISKARTAWLRRGIAGGDFKKFTTTASGVISDSCLDEFSILERNDFFSEVLKLVFEGNEEPSDSNSIS